MRIVRCHRAGGPEVLQLDDVPVPSPAAGELLVEVGAAGVTWPVVRSTRAATAFPLAPSGEVAGRVAALGPGVEGWTVGQRVAALTFGGAYAQFATVHAAMAVAVPDDVSDVVSDVDAAALVRSGQVALGALWAGGFGPDTQSVLVTAAAGGVGNLVVQIARAAGTPRIVAAAGAHAKAGFLRELGATETVAYADAAWGEPVELAVDAAGGPVQARTVDALAAFGRVVSVNGIGAPVEANELRMHSRAVIGFAMPHLVRFRPELYQRHAAQLWELARSGAVRPRIAATLPLSGAAEAHRMLEERANLGKVVLVPG